eukprot:gene11922-15166_t
MGKAMALWLVPVEDNNSTDDLECDQSYDSEEVLRIWMRVALSREFHTTTCRVTRVWARPSSTWKTGEGRAQALRDPHLYKDSSQSAQGAVMLWVDLIPAAEIL